MLHIKYNYKQEAMKKQLIVILAIIALSISANAQQVDAEYINPKGGWSAI